MQWYTSSAERLAKSKLSFRLGASRHGPGRAVGATSRFWRTTCDWKTEAGDRAMSSPGGEVDNFEPGSHPRQGAGTMSGMLQLGLHKMEKMTNSHFTKRYDRGRNRTYKDAVDHGSRHWTLARGISNSLVERWHDSLPEQR